MTKLENVLRAIDEANSADPKSEDGQPTAKLYGLRMSEEANRLFPNASDTLQIAARGQHVERWVLERKSYPEGKVGYHAWRRDLAKHHASRVANFMSEAGYSEEDIAAAERMLHKEGIKRHDDVQALEDIICFVFLKWYFVPFAAKHDDAKVLDIVQKTARKMSNDARERVLQEFDLPEPLASAFSLQVQE
ncbi:MAG: DUF4202 domain-containing protein [Roseibium sp.]